MKSPTNNTEFPATFSAKFCMGPNDKQKELGHTHLHIHRMVVALRVRGPVLTPWATRTLGGQSVKPVTAAFIVLVPKRALHQSLVMHLSVSVSLHQAKWYLIL
jgi:hypothetical protein